jgi:hypothetical protein
MVKVTLTIDDSRIFVVPAGKTKHGPNPSWGKDEYALAAIGTLFNTGGVPDRVGDLKLWDKVKKCLGHDKVYCDRFGRDKHGHGKISRQTVMRARDKFHAVNHLPRKERCQKAPPKPTSVTGPLARGALRRQPLTAEEIRAIADRAERK